MSEHATKEEVAALRSTVRALMKLNAAIMRELMKTGVVTPPNRGSLLLSDIAIEVSDRELRDHWDREVKETAAVATQLLAKG